MTNFAITRMPPGWVSSTLGKLGIWSSGGTPSRTNADFYGGTIPWVKTGELEDGMIFCTEECLTQAGLEASSAKLFPAGTLLMAMYGATIGKLGLLQHPAATNQACAALLSCGETEHLIPFVFHYLRLCRDEFRSVGQGGAQPNISLTLIKAHSCPLPPLNEQRRIVAKIEALQSRSDAAKQALDAIPPLLEKLRQSVLAAAFRGDLTKAWREAHPDVEPASKLLERIRAERRRRWEEANPRKKYVEPEGVDSAGLPELPEGWCWARAEELAWEITVGHVGPMKHRYVSSGVPFLRSQNVRENRFDATGLLYIDEGFHRELPKSTLCPGDLLVVRSGDPGTACVVPAEIERANCADLVITRLLPGLDPTLTAFYINSSFARNQVRDAQVGMAQQHFNVGSMKQLSVPLMPEQEQKPLLAVLTRHLESVNLLRCARADAASQLATLTQSILAKAFRGELVPQDPSDEPASVLLERIRAEREATPTRPRATKRPRARKTTAKAR